MVVDVAMDNLFMCFRKTLTMIIWQSHAADMSSTLWYLFELRVGLSWHRRRLVRTGNSGSVQQVTELQQVV